MKNKMKIKLPEISIIAAVSNDGIPFEVKRKAPNKETKLALAEYEEMKNHPEKYKRYGSFDEVLDEVLEDA